MTAYDGSVLLALSLRQRGAYGGNTFKTRVIHRVSDAQQGEVPIRVQFKIPRVLFQPCAPVVRVEVAEPVTTATARTEEP